MQARINNKQDRINIRLQHTAKETLEYAALLEGKTISGFIVNSALTHAEKTIHDHNIMMLSRQDSEAFLHALTHPPKPNKKLILAMEEYRKRVISK